MPKMPEVPEVPEVPEMPEVPKVPLLLTDQLLGPFDLCVLSSDM